MKIPFKEIQKETETYVAKTTFILNTRNQIISKTCKCLHRLCFIAIQNNTTLVC